MLGFGPVEERSWCVVLVLAALERCNKSLPASFLAGATPDQLVVLQQCRHLTDTCIFLPVWDRVSERLW